MNTTPSDKKKAVSPTYPIDLSRLHICNNPSVDNKELAFTKKNQIHNFQVFRPITLKTMQLLQLIRHV